jgi:predicted esterase
MSQEVMVENLGEVEDFYKRPDLEVLKILEYCRKLLNANNIGISEEYLIGGISAGANFVNRFSILHPDKIRAVALLMGGDFLYFQEYMEGAKFDYPFGINNINQIIPNEIDIDKFL